jgi:hypothetical protein
MRWQDGASCALGAWLAVSPWLLGFSEHLAATANTAVLGLLLIALSLLDLWLPETAEERLNLIAGLWLMFAPLVLGYSTQLAPTMNSVVAGLLVALFAAWAMAHDREPAHWRHDDLTWD